MSSQVLGWVVTVQDRNPLRFGSLLLSNLDIHEVDLGMTGNIYYSITYKQYHGNQWNHYCTDYIDSTWYVRMYHLQVSIACVHLHDCNT